MYSALLTEALIINVFILNNVQQRIVEKWATQQKPSRRYLVEIAGCGLSLSLKPKRIFYNAHA